MSDSEEPKQQPTPSKTPKRPQAPERADSDQSDDPGYQSRSRSQSRRRRRQNQRQRAQQQQQQKQDGGGGQRAQAQSMASIEEEQSSEAQAKNTMQPFERIGMLSLRFQCLVLHRMSIYSFARNHASIFHSSSPSPLAASATMPLC
jgi:hypothetical protein